LEKSKMKKMKKKIGMAQIEIHIQKYQLTLAITVRTHA